MPAPPKLAGGLLPFLRNTYSTIFCKRKKSPLASGLIIKALRLVLFFPSLIGSALLFFPFSPHFVLFFLFLIFIFNFPPILSLTLSDSYKMQCSQLWICS